MADSIAHKDLTGGVPIVPDQRDSEIAALRAENERLWAALKRINVGFVSAKDAPAEHDEAIRIVRAALEEKP